MNAVAILAGLFLPLLAAAGLTLLAADSLLAVVAVLTFSAALASLKPPGGGMVMHGTTRVRFLWWSATYDRERSPSEALLGTFLLTAAVIGGFCLPALVVAPLWWAGSAHLPVTEETAVILSVALLLGLSLPQHRRELPLRLWREALESTEPLEDEVLEQHLVSLKSRQRPDGSIGHVGGIGTAEVGLHELLDVERILREAEARGLEGAASLRSALLEHLAGREIEGGFPVYPGGLPREQLTARAREALGTA